MPKSARTLIPVAALTLCLLTGGSSTSTSATPTVSQSATLTTASVAPSVLGSAPASVAMGTSAAPAPSTAVAGSSSATGNGLVAAPETDDRLAGWQLPSSTTIIGSTAQVAYAASTDTSTSDSQTLVGYSPNGQIVWQSGAANADLANSHAAIVDGKIYAFSPVAITTGTGALAKTGRGWAVLTFDTTKSGATPTTSRVVDLTPVPQNGQADYIPQFVVSGTTVDVFNNLTPTSNTSSTTVQYQVQTVDLTTGKLTNTTLPLGDQPIAVDSNGSVVTFNTGPGYCQTGDTNCGATFAYANWKIKVPYVDGLESNQILGGYTVLPTGGAVIAVQTTTTAGEIINADGKVLAKVDAVPTNPANPVLSPNGKWGVWSTFTWNNTTGKTFNYAESATQTAAKFTGVADDGTAYASAQNIAVNLTTGDSNTITSAWATSTSYPGGWTTYSGGMATDTTLVHVG